MLEIMPKPPNLYLLRFDHEQDLHFVLTNGPWSIYGQPLMLQRFKLGMSPHSLSFASIFIWMMFVGLPFLRRNKYDICLLMKDDLPIYRIEPLRSQTVPTEGHKILTLIDVNKHVPFGLIINEEGIQTQVCFLFKHLPPQFCSCCHRLGHKINSCEEAPPPQGVAPPHLPPVTPLILHSVGPSKSVGAHHKEPRQSNFEPLKEANVVSSAITTHRPRCSL